MTKLQKIRDAAAAGDWRKAVSIASKFADLGDEADAIRRAQSAVNNPAFYKQIGRDPDADFAAGIAAIKRRWGI